MRASSMNGSPRVFATVVAVLAISGSLAVAAEPSFGIGAPTIAFLNPSSFASAGERGIIVSDAQPDVGPGSESTDGRYRLAAWVGNAPIGSLVYFSVKQRTIDIEIAANETSGSANTWEAGWEISPEILDGPATISAYLVMGDEAIATVNQDVTIMRTQERAELTYPRSGGSFGTYAPLASALPETGAATRKNPIGIVDAAYWSGVDVTYVRAFYTTSAPGTKPTWKVCGTEAIGSSNGQADNGVRCQLENPADQTAITAMATVANDSPDSYEDRFNQAGDAVPITTAYAQELAEFSLVTEGFQQVDRELLSQEFYCSTAEVVQLQDQLGRQIAGANIDVHATGPNDQLAFHTFSVLTVNQAPDRGSHTVETAFDCTGQKFQGSTAPPGNANPSDQGEHSRFGLPDRKHIETLEGGTNDIGRFSFMLHSQARGTTGWTAWIDESDDGCLTNDDAFSQGEPSVSGVIGWGEGPGSVTPEPYDIFVPCTPASPGPSPSPTDGPGTDFDGSRSVALRMVGTPSVGERAEFAGRIAGARAACERDQKVVLKMRRPGQRYWTVSRTRTDDAGRFSLTAPTKVPRDYRAVAPATTRCDRAGSAPIKLRAE